MWKSKCGHSALRERRGIPAENDSRHSWNVFLWHSQRLIVKRVDSNRFLVSARDQPKDYVTATSKIFLYFSLGYSVKDAVISHNAKPKRKATLKHVFERCQ